MKNLMISLVALAISAGLSSCSLLDDNSQTPSGTVPSAGPWKVSYFFDKKDETSNYLGYSFDFASNGQLTATNGTQIYTGTWKTGYDDSKNKFLINFIGTHPSALEELEEDWLIVEQTSGFMNFTHISGGNGDTDVLQFTKE